MRIQSRTVVVALLLLALTACSASAPTATVPAHASVPAVTPTAAVPAKEATTPPTPAPPLAATTAPAAPATGTPAVQGTPTPLTSPAWFNQAVLYEIFPRSFYDANGDGIGDLKGIIQKLDYLQKLGVDTLWLTPIFKAASYHGYDTIDYLQVSPDFGTNDDLIALNREVHKRGMHILLDYVANHVSDKSPWFQDAYKNPASKYSNWFVWLNSDHSDYVHFEGAPGMPKLNLDNPETRDYMLGVAKHWLDPSGNGNLNDGVDGYRCDYALGPSHSFWQALRQTVKKVNPNALLLGEVLQYQVSTVAAYYGTNNGPREFDATFDYPLRGILAGEHNDIGTGLINGKGLGRLLTGTFQDEQQQFPAGAESVRFLSDHDTNRDASVVKGSAVQEEMGAAILATLPSTPMVYYGEEIGMFGSRGFGPLYDEYRREPMEWYAADAGPGQPAWFHDPKQYDKPNDGVSVEEEEGKPDSLLNQYRRLMGIRRSDPALLSGAVEAMSLPDCVKCTAFWRIADHERVLVAYNFSAQPVTATLTLTDSVQAPTAPPLDLLTGQPTRALAGVSLKLDGWQAIALKWP